MKKLATSISISILLIGATSLHAPGAMAHHLPFLTVTPAEFDESAGKVLVAVTSSCINEFEARYETKDKTAEAGRDFLPANGTLRLRKDSPQELQLSVLQDRLLEGYESFYLEIVGLPNGSAGGAGSGSDAGTYFCPGGGSDSPNADTFTLTITDDDIYAQNGSRSIGPAKSGAASSPSNVERPQERLAVVAGSSEGTTGGVTPIRQSEGIPAASGSQTSPLDDQRETAGRKGTGLAMSIVAALAVLVLAVASVRTRSRRTEILRSTQP